MSTGLIQQVVLDYYAATRAMDVDAWLATMCVDVVAYQPVGMPPLKGHREMRQFFKSLTGGFATMGLTEEFVHFADNQVAVKWKGRGVGKNGREVTFEGIDLLEINAMELIQTVWAYWNPAAVIVEVQN